MKGLAHRAEAAVCARLFRRDGVKSVQVRRVREPDGDLWELISEPHEGIEITTADPLIASRELEAFISGLNDRPIAPKAPAARDRAASAKHDWENFYAALTAEIHENGVPGTMQELALKMESWFVENGDPTKVDAVKVVGKRK